MSEEMKHTPGEWLAVKGHDGEPERWCVVQDGEKQYVIAVIENGAPGDFLETEEANAKLFAASRRLLAACEAVIKYSDMFNLGRVPKVRKELSNAIAKARGEK